MDNQTWHDIPEFWFHLKLVLEIPSTLSGLCGKFKFSKYSKVLLAFRFPPRRNWRNSSCQILLGELVDFPFKRFLSNSPLACVLCAVCCALKVFTTEGKQFTMEDTSFYIKIYFSFYIWTSVLPSSPSHATAPPSFPPQIQSSVGKAFLGIQQSRVVSDDKIPKTFKWAWKLS